MVARPKVFELCITQMHRMKTKMSEGHENRNHDAPRFKKLGCERTVTGLSRQAHRGKRQE